MIQTYTYRTPVAGEDYEAVASKLRTRVTEIARNRNVLRGCQIEHVDGVLELRLRMSGVDRWRIADAARKLGTFLLAAEGLAFTHPLQPFQVVTESNRRHLTAENGRTPREHPGRGKGRDRQAALGESVFQENASSS